MELTFERNVLFEGPLGIKKKTQALRMQLDDADRFVSLAQAPAS